MSDEIKVYQSADFGEVRTVIIDGRTWFVAMDIAWNLAYRDAANLTRLIPEDEKGYSMLSTPSGEQRVSILSEAGLYRACMTRATAYIKDPVTRERVERFQRWILHEVLPGIREQGYYLNLPPEQLAPEDLDRLTAYTMAGLAARNAALEQRVEELRPKAEFAEAVSAAPDCIEVRDLGHLLCQNGFRGMGRGNTFKFLREEKYLFKNAGGYNVPYQKWINQGLFEIQETTWKAPDGTVHASLKTMVTQKGVEHFLRRYAPDRRLPGLGDGDAA